MKSICAVAFAATVCGVPSSAAAQTATDYGTLTSMWQGKALDYDVSTAWQGCNGAMVGRVPSGAGQDEAAALCASAALTTCVARRKPGDPSSMSACIDAQAPPEAAASLRGMRPADISDVPIVQAKAEVKSRLVAEASMANGAHAQIDDDKVICQHTAVTGSNIPGAPVCATKRQWRDRSNDNAAFAADFEQRNRQVGQPEPNGRVIANMSSVFGR